MKIRKILALLVALSMVAVVIPGFGITASAAIKKNQGIVTTDGDAYVSSSDDYVVDGSFETDAWEDALTTGAFVDVSGGKPGRANVIKMNSDKTVNERFGPAFVLVEGRNGGKAISPAVDNIGSSDLLPKYTNDANGPSSIKQYYKGSGGRQTFYVSFWAKATDQAASGKTIFSYYIDSIAEQAAIGSPVSVTIGDEWTHIDAVAEVVGSNYLIVNIFNMTAGEIAIDDVEVCTVSRSSDANDFSSARSQWRTVFPYVSGQTLSNDINLPRSCGKATVSWSSSDENLLSSSTGKIALIRDDAPVTLYATLTVKSFTYTYEYNFTVAGYANRIMNILDDGGLVEKYPDPKQNIELPQTLESFDGSVITWQSSDPDVIDPATGEYNAPDSVKSVTLTATVAYKGESYGPKEYTVYVGLGIKHSLIPNGAFEVSENNQVLDWTVGDLSTMNVGPDGTFDLMTDDTGNHYILSKNHKGGGDPSSIRNYVELEPGKFYNFSFKLWYNGEASCQECYTAAVLVPNNTTTIDDSGNGDVAPTSTYGGFPFPKNSWNGRYSKEQGWQTVNVGLLRPDEKYHTLLIDSRWLNKTDGGLSDGRWAFDDFILEEIVSDFTADVTINYLDEDGEPIKSPRVARDQYGNIEYFAEDSDKSDFSVGRVSYRYDPSRSTDHVLVTEDEETNVINLYFQQLIPSEVTIEFIDRATGDELKTPVTVKRDSYVGFSYTAPNDYKAAIERYGVQYEYDPSSNDTIIVDEDPDNNIITLYFYESSNLIMNGDFNNGTVNWINRIGTQVTGGTIDYDDEIGANAFTTDTGGRTASTSIGTAWNVVSGRQYHLSFYVGGNKPSDTNYQYNKISNGYVNNGGVREISGDILMEYGELMENGKWNHMELDFTATTNVVYFQSSWCTGIKFAKFELTEVDESDLGSVQINFQDQDGEEIQDPVTVDDLVGGSTYNVPAQYLKDIQKGNILYKYRDDNVTSAVVAAGETVEITLKFDKVTTADVVLSFVDKATQTTIKGDVTLQGEIGQLFNIPSEYKQMIPYGGKNYSYESCDPVALTVGNENNKITLYFKEVSNIIENGNFETELEGDNIPQWGTGAGNETDVAQMTTAHFDYVTDSDQEGNHYIQSKKSDGLSSTGSLKRYVKLTPGKQYAFSFRVKRASGDKATEAWIEAPLVKDDLAEIRENNTDHNTIVSLRETYGSLIPEKVENGGADMTQFLIGPGDGWVTVERTLKPDETYNTLLIGAKWLDDKWCFDDFTLVEIGDVEYGNVVLHYVDGEGNTIKTDDIIESVPSGAYTVPSSYTTDIDNEGVLYKFNAGKTNLKTEVVAGDNVEVTLYYDVAPSTITISGDKATVKANAAVNGLVVVTQFDGDGKLVDVKTTPVQVEAGATGDVNIVFNTEAGAVKVKAFVIDSLTSLKPLANVATGVTPDAPLTGVVWQSDDALHEVTAASGNVRYTYDFVDNGCVDAAIILGDAAKVKTVGGDGKYNFYGNGSIELLFGKGEMFYRTSDAAGGKTKLCDYTVGEKIHVEIVANIVDKTYTITVTTAAGETSKDSVAFRVDIDTVDILALVENSGDGTFGDKAPFEVYDFNVEPLD